MVYFHVPYINQLPVSFSCHLFNYVRSVMLDICGGFNLYSPKDFNPSLSHKNNSNNNNNNNNNKNIIIIIIIIIIISARPGYTGLMSSGA